MTGPSMSQSADADADAAVRALAEADFSEIADRFASAGFDVRLPARGILQINAAALPQGFKQRRLRLLLSVGVHGDETAPIEMLAHLLAELAQTPRELGVDLMVVVGNLGAIAQGKRFLDADLNRLFSTERGELQATQEAARADLIMRATAAFFAAPGAQKWHLDLHTAIRPSLYPTFAVVPDNIADADKHTLNAWLGGAGIGAIILNSITAPTYSAYSASQFGAASCTAELGQIGTLGQNDLSQFAVTSAALNVLLRSGETLAFRRSPPHVFRVAQEIVKRHAEFSMAFDKSTRNFTALEPGAVIAQDGDAQYRVGERQEFVVFPNPDVRVGQRAGLMVVRD